MYNGKDTAGEFSRREGGRGGTHRYIVFQYFDPQHQRQTQREDNPETEPTYVRQHMRESDPLDGVKQTV